MTADGSPISGRSRPPTSKTQSTRNAGSERLNIRISSEPLNETEVPLKKSSFSSDKDSTPDTGNDLIS
jgi:hypothetical protein